MKTVSIAELIRDTVVFVLGGSNVRCDFSIDESLWPVEIDKEQISQVIKNLIVNADQAMPEGGVIKVLAENVAEGMEHMVPLKEGRYVKISIVDQGVGIPEEHFEKIYDPYFTTKHKGSGLGLATSYSVLKNHEGYITVESELGKGTAFHFYLPASDVKIPDVEYENEKLIKGRGKILLMDNEESLRNAVKEMLGLIGYEVDLAEDGVSAIELYKKALADENPYDAVILDLTVPGGMGGKKTIERLLEIDPRVKAILSSGYSNDPVMADFEKYGFKGVLAKPCGIERLSEVINKVIME